MFMGRKSLDSCIYGDRRPSLVLFDSLHFWLNYDLVYNPLNIIFFQVCKNFDIKMLNKVPLPLLTQTRTEQLNSNCFFQMY